MKFLISLLLICFVSFARGGGFSSGGGSRGSSYSRPSPSYSRPSPPASSPTSVSPSKSSSPSTRGSGYSKSSPSSNTPNSSSTRGSGYSKPFSSESSHNYFTSRERLAPHVYVYRYAPPISTYYWHPFLGFGYYRSNMSFMEMYMWNTIMFPNHYYNQGNYQPLTCNLDKDCLVKEYCNLKVKPNICVERKNSGIQSW